MVYEIPKHPKIIQAFKYAKVKAPNRIQLVDLNQVCDKNIKNWKIPIEYQYVWFCLHSIRIQRQQGNIIFNPKVVFYPIFVEIDKAISNLIRKVIVHVGSREKFVHLLNRKCSKISSWLTLKKKVPLTAILKTCQILKLDPWYLLKNKFLSSQSNDIRFIFKNQKNEDIADILAWIKLEGHLFLSNSRLEIEQKTTGSDAIFNIAERIQMEFGDLPIKFLKRSDKDNLRLRINSTVLREILVLRYGIDLGYKSHNISLSSELKNSNLDTKSKIVACAMETEGHFGYYLSSAGHKNPRYTFTSASRKVIDELHSVLKWDFGLNPIIEPKDKKIWRISIRRSSDCIILAKYILPHMKHKQKIENILQILNQPIFNKKIGLY